MKQILVLIILVLSFVCEGQTKMEDIDNKDIVEIKGLVYLKADTTLVTGKVIRYNNKKEAKRYILIVKGIPDKLGWINLNKDKFIEPKESALGSIVTMAAGITSATMAITGSDLNIPYQRNTNEFTGNDLKSFHNDHKDYTKKAYSDMSDRNEISKKLNSQQEASNGLIEEYYDDGQLEIKGNYLNGKKDSLREEYHKNGQLKSKGYFIEGKEDGLWERYHSNGVLNSKVNYTNGIKDGLYEEYYYNGQLWSQGKYIVGRKTGEWKTYHKNGQLEEIGNYLVGRTIDLGQFDSVTINKLQVNINSDLGFKTGEWKTNDESGAMRIENSWDGKKASESGYHKKGYNVREYKTGEWKYYDENGKLTKTENFD